MTNRAKDIGFKSRGGEKYKGICDEEVDFTGKRDIG